MTKKTQNSSIRLILLFLVIAYFSSYAYAADNSTSQYNTQYSKKGADTCVMCHDEENEYPIFPIFETKHGEINDPNSPMGKLQCETCHGAIGKHNKRPPKGQKRAPAKTLGCQQQNKTVCAYNATQIIVGSAGKVVRTKCRIWSARAAM